MGSNTKYAYRNIVKDDYREICSMPQDADELYFMYPKASYPLTENQLVENLKTRYNPTVFEDNGRVIGFANFYDLAENEHCSLGNLVVHPSYRGRGTGRFIVETMEEIAFKLYNVKELHISCFNNNIAGLILYNRMQYKPFGIEERINKDGEIQILIKMKKKLNT